MSKTFTLAEAQTLLPVLESLLKKAQQSGTKAAELEVEFERLRQRIFLSGGTHIDVASTARRRAERDKALQETQDTLNEIDEIGVKVKDLEKGLLDFPSTMEGKTILLCWKLGEKEIGYWHSEEEGFAGRKPIDARFGRTERQKPN
ncbi:MAG TPA: DUF2203 domain-containing protein [Edaphobacter sp.]|nr:DUF2203 domain-containing protein [Edaphobacter sp.]